MTTWLRKRLALWMGVSLLGSALVWNVGALRAQNGDPFGSFTVSNSVSADVSDAELETQRQKLKKLSRDDAARQFMLALNDEFDAYNYLRASVSNRSIDLLGTQAGTLVHAMTKQWKVPRTKVKSQTQKGKKAIVIAEQTFVTRPLIMVEENGSWGIDLIETYAKWNNLQGVAKARAIYKLTNVILDELPQDDNFKRTHCQTNLRQIALGIKQYVQDYDEKFPPAKEWIDVLQPYVRSEAIFNCPSLPKNSRYGYAFNFNLSGKLDDSYDIDQMDKSAKNISLYETTILKGNAYGSGDNLAFRHQNGANYAFADGHVKWFAKSQTPSFDLKPFKNQR